MQYRLDFDWRLIRSIGCNSCSWIQTVHTIDHEHHTSESLNQNLGSPYCSRTRWWDCNVAGAPARQYFTWNPEFKRGWNSMTWRRTLHVLTQHSFMKGAACTERVHHVALANILPQHVSSYPWSSVATSLGLSKNLTGPLCGTHRHALPRFPQLSRPFQTPGCSITGGPIVREFNEQQQPPQAAPASFSVNDDGALTQLQPATLHLDGPSPRGDALQVS